MIPKFKIKNRKLNIFRKSDSTFLFFDCVFFFVQPTEKKGRKTKKGWCRGQSSFINKTNFTTHKRFEGVYHINIVTHKNMYDLYY